MAADIPPEIAKLISNAKRHHYVPEFSLRRFSIDPSAEPAHIYQLDVRGGRTSRPSIKDCCVVSNFNTITAAPNTPPGLVEALLSYIEGLAAPHIEKLVQGKDLPSEAFAELAQFVLAQQQRTPRGREALNFTIEQSGTMWALKRIYEDRDFSRDFLQQRLGRPPTEDEVDQQIRDFAQPLEEGELKAVAHHDVEIMSMFLSFEDVLPLIYEMHWLLVEAPKGENFILSDEPLVRYDPNNPHGPSGWRSSPTVEVTIPLDPSLCLVLQRAPASQTHRIIATPDQVQEINLRTYASAREAIFGPRQELLQDMRRVAKRNSAVIPRYRPKPSRIHIIESVQGDGSPFKVSTTQGPTEVKIRRSRR